LIDRFPESIHTRDFYGRTAFEEALENKCSVEVIHALVTLSLPFDQQTTEPHDVSMHGYAWAQLVEYDEYVSVVDAIITEHQHLNSLLAHCNDRKVCFSLLL
jgi:hypothetical protein